MSALTSDAELEELERDYVGRLRGRVLEIGAGDGENFGPLDPEVQWVGLEPDARRRPELRRRAKTWGHRDVLEAKAERIPLPDHSVDAVLGTYVLCSVDDVAATVAELRRVLVPGGRVVLIDHVVAAGGAKRAAQRMMTLFTARFCNNCHQDRDPEPALIAAGFTDVDVRRIEVGSWRPIASPVLLYEGVAPG
jgi:ubiquinone/menaquinone biosynthesis C-methylase UbiE